MPINYIIKELTDEGRLVDVEVDCGWGGVSRPFRWSKHDSIEDAEADIKSKVETDTSRIRKLRYRKLVVLPMYTTEENE